MIAGCVHLHIMSLVPRGFRGLLVGFGYSSEPVPVPVVLSARMLSTSSVNPEHHVH